MYIMRDIYKYMGSEDCLVQTKTVYPCCKFISEIKFHTYKYQNFMYSVEKFE